MSTARLACAAHVRTSTDDQQAPEDSFRWQLDIAADTGRTQDLTTTFEPWSG